MKFRIVFWDVLPCKMIFDRRFRGACCLHRQGWARYFSLYKLEALLLLVLAISERHRNRLVVREIYKSNP